MRGQHHHLRRAGLVSAGTLAIVLAGAAAPAAADETEAGTDASDDQKCKDGDGLLSTVTGLVCDTTDTTKNVLDGATGGATKDLTDGVQDTVDGLGDGASGDGGGDDADSPDPPPSGGAGGSSDNESPGGSGNGGGGSKGGSGGGSGGGSDGGGDPLRERLIGAAGSPAGARGEALEAAGGGGDSSSPYLQPLSPVAGLHPNRSLESSSTETEPKLPEIAPSPVPSPEPTPVEEQRDGYAEPASGGQPYDRGEGGTSPALMVIFAIVAAGVVTGGHVAVVQARLRNRRVN